MAHIAGGSFVGEMTIAVGTNLNATPPQATSSAYTCCERDFYRALLRMPRGPEDDVEHPKNNRAPRDEEPPPARPVVAVPSTSGLDAKLPMVLEQVARITTIEHYERAVAGFHRATELRGAPLDDGEVDLCGYSDAGFARVQAAFAAAHEALANRVLARLHELEPEYVP